MNFFVGWAADWLVPNECIVFNAQKNDAFYWIIWASISIYDLIIR